MGRRGIDWIDVAQDRDRWRAVVNTVMNLWVPYYAGNFLNSFSGRSLLHGVSLVIPNDIPRMFSAVAYTT
jgi:hypothetical protein